MDIARRALSDIPECAAAEYRVRWHDLLPVLIIAFVSHPTLNAVPALGIALMTVRRDTLADVMPGKTLLEGDRLRDRVLACAHDYLRNHGVRVSLPDAV